MRLLVRIHALTVGKNEADRYLTPMLRNLIGVFDTHFFFDDRSTDNTVMIAKSFCSDVIVRTPDQPSFVENEGAFRDTAWTLFRQEVRPEVGDFVFVIDCDEFLVTDGLRAMVATAVEDVAIGMKTKVATDIRIHEIFDYADGIPLERTDVLWGTIHGPRFFRYRTDGGYLSGDFGVPAVPQYVMTFDWAQTEQIALAHFGHCKEEDRMAKYNRYTGHNGHSNIHVESILSPEKHLEAFTSLQPRVPWDQLL